MIPVLLTAFLARRSSGQDFDAQLKWTEAKVVHYKIVGDFTGKMAILGGAHTSRRGAVTDQVEFEFDWDNQEMAMLGTPVLRNFPTKLGAIDPSPIEGCPPLRLDEPPDFASVTKVTAAFVLLHIELKWQTGRGALPWIASTSSSSCGDLWDSATPSEGTFKLDLQLPPGMMLAMAPEASGYDRSKDGKSLLTKPENGWTWSITPTIVR